MQTHKRQPTNRVRRLKMSLTKKPTKATLKAFIKKHGTENLFIKISYEHNGDGTYRAASKDYSFKKCETEIRDQEHSLGIKGVYVIGGKNFISSFDDGVYEGFECGNCCINFFIAIKKESILK